MSGEFMSVGMDDDGVVKGYTHGCTCCAKRVERVSVEQMDEHISTLEQVLAKAKKLRAAIIEMDEAAKRIREAL